MSKFIFAALLFLPLSLRAVNIPDSLLANASQVVLEDETVFTIWNPQRAQLQRNYRTLVLQKSAFGENAVVLHYSDFTKVKEAHVWVKDAQGKEIKSYALKNFDDIAAGGAELASDDRIKVLQIPEFTPPVSLEVTYTLEYKGYMFYPRWYPIRREKQSLLTATFSVQNRSDNPIRYQSLNLDEPQIAEEEEGTIYTWSVANLPALAAEPFGGPVESYLPLVITAPTSFEMDGYAGDMSSWQDFGQWFVQLNEGRNNLTEAQLSEVRDLVKDLPSDREKAKAVYHYLQQRMRYVSIQLGIGGWQPFDASFVHEKKYGDCKALTFYAKALLDALGIPAYYTLIRAGEDERHAIAPEFPSPFFNHVILTVPLATDTVWLECTSQTAPFGYLGTFTSDRSALLIAEDGGRLIQTRAYSAEENVQQTRARIRYEEDGTRSLDLDRSFSGLEIEREGLYFLLDGSRQEQEDWLHDHLGSGGVEMTNWSLLPLKGEVAPKTGLSLAGKFSNWKGNRIFVRTGELAREIGSDLPENGRRSPVEVAYPFTETDSIFLYLPPGFEPESIPPPLVIETPFGKYQRRFEMLDAHSALLVREWILNKGLYPQSEYAGFRAFLLDVRKADRQRMVWKKAG
jgi:hypothetical protein